MAKKRTISQTRITYLILILFVISWSLRVEAQELDENYFIQVASFEIEELTTAFELAHLFQARGFADSRIEKGANLFHLKIGNSTKKNSLTKDLREVKILFPKAIIKRGVLNPKARIFPLKGEDRQYDQYARNTGKSVFCLQLLSTRDLDVAQKYSKFLQGNGYKDFWIEQIDEYYTLRLGKTNNLGELQKIKQDLKDAYPTSFILLAYYYPEKVITKPLGSEEKTEKPYHTILVTNSVYTNLSTILETAYIFNKNGLEDINVIQKNGIYSLFAGDAKDKSALKISLSRVKMLYPHAKIVLKNRGTSENIIYDSQKTQQNDILMSYGKNMSISTFTIQLLSTNTLQKAIKYAKPLELDNRTEFWIEKIDEYFVLRLGHNTDILSLNRLKQQLEPVYPTSFIRVAYFHRNKVLYPIEKTEAHSVQNRNTQKLETQTKAPVPKQSEAKQTTSEPKKIKELPENNYLEKELVLDQFIESSPSLIIVSILLFIAMLVIPFTPGISELRKPKDNLPLFIDMNYTKDPRFFDRSFKKKLLDAIHMVYFEHAEKVTLSKIETVEIIKGDRIKEYNESDSVLYLMNDLETTDNMVFVKEIYVNGKAVLGQKNFIRSIMVEQDLTMKKDSILVRWMGANGSIFVEDNCLLGLQVSSEKLLKLGKLCKFKRLFGNPIITYDGEQRDNPIMLPEREHNYDPDKINEITDMDVLIEENDLIVYSHEKIEKDIIAMKKVRIQQGSVINGSIKCYNSVTVENGVQIRGDIFADKDIIIKENCAIYGNIFAHNNVTIGTGSIIGKKGVVKSVIGKLSVHLSQNVIVYGYVLTEKEGLII